ncbi:thioredoxin-like fold domain-containing protein MRL7 homolog, chloroplastic [Phoenix dactylifera]|uniref:Thioredoxin-like fold domain-containing protein MRL7 homolog, chloroplastic n=1 Tax=Phoenix dactylifera TaxID=42345 RepID=A0A8B7BYW5_PHODC|nr:thioredoxin-like fold domain-containing protein MRL7 homolog, chloroplastic [Phoenix dactylifera]
MSSLQIRTLFPKPFFQFFAASPSSFPLFVHYPNPDSSSFTRSFSRRNPRRRAKPFVPLKASATPDPSPNSNSDPDPRPSPNPTKPKGRRSKPKTPAGGTATAASGDAFPSTIPQKPRRGRRSEAAAVEDFVRDRLDRTFASIREQDAGVLEGKEEVLKQRTMEEDEEESSEGGGKEVVEEEDPDWPLDADIGWGIRASEYFEKHPIKNVVVDGVEIDWEREMDEGWVKEINCLEWETFAFHPSPLVVLVFERYRRAADNWKLLKELEKAAKVYWNAKDRLPPRTVKIDINIETDLAYALKVKECPQLLFVKGNRILYREKELRTADELVQMIAHFYYNAKRPSWIDPAEVAPPF